MIPCRCNDRRYAAHSTAEAAADLGYSRQHISGVAKRERLGVCLGNRRDRHFTRAELERLRALCPTPQPAKLTAPPTPLASFDYLPSQDPAGPFRCRCVAPQLVGRLHPWCRQCGSVVGR